MTLAEIRELLLRELTACALAGNDTDDFARGGPRSIVLRRVGKPLVLRHVRPGQRIRWYEKLYGDEPLVVERVEADQLMFESPRLVIAMSHFLNAVAKGAAVDA